MSGQLNFAVIGDLIVLNLEAEERLLAGLKGFSAFKGGPVFGLRNHGPHNVKRVPGRTRRLSRQRAGGGQKYSKDSAKTHPLSLLQCALARRP